MAKIGSVTPGAVGLPRAPAIRRGNRPPANWTIPPGHVGLFCPDPWCEVVVPLGTEPPSITGGVGGWEVTTRPRQVGITTWAGTEPYGLELAVMFDGFAGNRPVEGVLRSLYKAARGDEDSDPHPWWIRGIPNLPADRWALQDIDAGDVIRRDADMRRVRQEITLTFIEWVPPTWVRIRKAALSKPRAKTTVYTCKAKDTPKRIAAKRGCKWTDIRELNPGKVKKARQDLAKGTKLRVPVAKPKGKHDTRDNNRRNG